MRRWSRESASAPSAQAERRSTAVPMSISGCVTPTTHAAMSTRSSFCLRAILARRPLPFPWPRRRPRSRHLRLLRPRSRLRMPPVRRRLSPFQPPVPGSARTRLANRRRWFGLVDLGGRASPCEGPKSPVARCTGAAKSAPRLRSRGRRTGRTRVSRRRTPSHGLPPSAQRRATRNPGFDPCRSPLVFASLSRRPAAPGSRPLVRAGGCVPKPLPSWPRVPPSWPLPAGSAVSAALGRARTTLV